MNGALIVAHHFALGGKPKRARLIFEKTFHGIQKGLNALKADAIHTENTHFGEDSIALKLLSIHHGIDIVMEQAIFDESGHKEVPPTAVVETDDEGCRIIESYGRSIAIEVVSVKVAFEIARHRVTHKPLF